MDEKKRKINKGHTDRIKQAAEIGSDDHQNHSGQDIRVESNEHLYLAGREMELEDKGKAYMAYFREHSSYIDQESLTAEQRQRIKSAVMGRGGDFMGESNVLDLQSVRGGGVVPKEMSDPDAIIARGANLGPDEKSSSGDTSVREGVSSGEKVSVLEEVSTDETMSVSEGVSVPEGIATGKKISSGDKKSIIRSRLLRNSVVPLAAVLIVLIGFVFVWQMFSKEMAGDRSSEDVMPEAVQEVFLTSDDENVVIGTDAGTDIFDSPAATQAAEPEAEPEALPPGDGTVADETDEAGGQERLIKDSRYSWVTELMSRLETDGWYRQHTDQNASAVKDFATVESTENSELVLSRRDAAANDELHTFGYYVFQSSDSYDVPAQKTKLEALFKEYQYSFISVSADIGSALAVLRSTDAQLGHIGELAAQGIMNQEIQEAVQIWLLWK